MWNKQAFNVTGANSGAASRVIRLWSDSTISFLDDDESSVWHLWEDVFAVPGWENFVLDCGGSSVCTLCIYGCVRVHLSRSLVGKEVIVCNFLRRSVQNEVRTVQSRRSSCMEQSASSTNTTSFCRLLKAHLKQSNFYVVNLISRASIA